MRALRMLFAGLVALFGLSVAGPASAGGFDYDYRGYYRYSPVVINRYAYTPPPVVYVYQVARPAPYHVHMIAYEHPGYYAYYGYRPYAYGVYWNQPYYRSYYPVRTAYPVRGYYPRRNHWK